MFGRSDGMADVTDSKSVGSDTVRVQVPPSAPRRIPPIDKGYFIGRWFLICGESVVRQGLRVFRSLSEGTNINEKSGILGAKYRVNDKRLGESFDFWVRVCILRGGVHRVAEWTLTQYNQRFQE